MTISRTTQKPDGIDLDVILTELGSFGKFQCINFFLICIPIIFNAVFTLSYIFTAGVPNHRCAIPECESTNKSTTEWISFAIPQRFDKSPEQCSRYSPISNKEGFECTKNAFNRSNVVKCSEFVFETPEKTIATEWNITCKENKWKLTLAGTVNHVAQLFCLPITGYVSDHYGRRTALVIGVVMGGIFGICRSLSVNYYMFMAFEFIDPLFSAGCYSVAFILGMEYLQPKYRVLGGVIISCFYAVGATLMGIIGYFFQDNWRHFLLAMYIPALLGFSYFWLIPESLRWLHTKSRVKEMTKIIKKAAKMNKKELSNKTIEVLARETENEEKLESNNESKHESPSVLVVFKSRKLLFRIANCSFCWLTNTFVYYGLSLNAVSLAGNKYFNFTFSNIIEIPAHLLALLLVNKIGRRWSMCGALVLAGLSCVATEFVSTDETQLRFVLYLIGKFSISISFTIIYVYTAEMFPTNLRNSLLGICSMFGRIGSISAPQTPLLATFYPSLPLFLFGGISMMAGVFSLSFPETLNSKLPDTIEEAIKMGDEHEMTQKTVD
ncbi:organic cation transporter protein-like [Culicoides brevitarsis]|uniref:organic cation transporter protein-like n=1 Tax=Culicoides brevitarsis TaxID=469753 RepID=UPI00307C0910